MLSRWVPKQRLLFGICRFRTAMVQICKVYNDMQTSLPYQHAEQLEFKKKKEDSIANVTTLLNPDCQDENVMVCVTAAQWTNPFIWPCEHLFWCRVLNSTSEWPKCSATVFVSPTRHHRNPHLLHGVWAHYNICVKRSLFFCSAHAKQPLECHSRVTEVQWLFGQKNK